MRVQKAHFDFKCLPWFWAGDTEQGSTVQFSQLWSGLGAAGKRSGNSENARGGWAEGCSRHFSNDSPHRTRLWAAFERGFSGCRVRFRGRTLLSTRQRDAFGGGVGNEARGKERCRPVGKSDEWQFYRQQVSLESSHKNPKAPHWSGGFSTVKIKEKKHVINPNIEF